jgi:hypothetical protein
MDSGKKTSPKWNCMDSLSRQDHCSLRVSPLSIAVQRDFSFICMTPSTAELELG